MEGLVCLVIILALCGPIAMIMAIHLYGKLDSISNRLKRIEASGNQPSIQPQTPKESVVPIPTVPPVPQQPPIPRRVPVSEVQPPKPVITASQIPMMPDNNVCDFKMPATADNKSVKPVKTPGVQIPKPVLKAGLEQKIGITVALIAGVITVIVGVGFFLKYVYENKLFSDLARVCLVAGGGLVSLIIGEIIRRRDYGIVAKGLGALGFSLLYASVFSACQVYHLIQPTTALILALCISAAAMAYAVSLNERLIAFLSLLGGYLSPLIIMYHQDMPMPIFTYVLALSMGAMGSAMFRRWRAVNWIAMTGTYLLYTVWFEQFYQSGLMPMSLIWITIFGMVYLLQPIVYNLLKKINSRAEDVSLIVINSATVFYYLCRVLYADYQKEMALVVAGFGVIHLLLMGFVMLRCRDDKKLPVVLSLLGVSLVTTAIGLYFAKMPPKILAWAFESIVLTFIGIRYKNRPIKAMSFLVAGVSVAALFYLLPLHGAAEFNLVFNGPFATWVFVTAVFFICHGMWRWMSDAKDSERIYAEQIFYIAAALLLATGSALEWHAFCDVSFEATSRLQACFVMGIMLIASVLLAVLSTRPMCPDGIYVRTTAMIIAIIGAIFTAVGSMGVYYTTFKLFVNVPFLIAGLFVASLFWAAYQFYRVRNINGFQKQFADATLMTGLILIGILITEQIYMYWYCRNEYAQPVANWQVHAWQYMTVMWTIYGLAMLFVAIRFKKMFMKALSITATVLSVIGLCYSLPLHKTGDFRFVFNLPFITWICASTGLISGHGLWRFMPHVEKQERTIPPQLYYVVGILIMGIGAALEWLAHCQMHITPLAAADSGSMLGCIALCAIVLLFFFARSIPPKGRIVQKVGLIVGSAGAIYTAFIMTRVYYKDFAVFANIPFMIALFYVTSLLAVAAFVTKETVGRFKLSSLIVLGALILLWVLLSEQIHQYFYCRNQYGKPVDNWRFSAQMYISLAWAIYAAALLLIGFFRRAAGIRYLSLIIFTVLLGKINWDIQELPTEYRIATFVTTGLILVGVSFLYQFLRKKGFFETIQSKKPEQLEKKSVNSVNPV